MDKPISPTRQLGCRWQPNVARAFGYGEGLGEIEPKRLLRGSFQRGDGFVDVVEGGLVIRVFVSCDSGLVVGRFVSFPVSFLTGSVAESDSLAGAVEFEWVALGGCGVTVGARSSSHDDEVVLVGLLRMVVEIGLAFGCRMLSW